MFRGTGVDVAPGLKPLTRSVNPPRESPTGPHQALRNRPRRRLLVLDKWGGGTGVLEYCARSELHPRSGLTMLTRRFRPRP